MTKLKSALVTGGSRGIGKATVRELTSKGYFVWFTYLEHREEAEALVDEIGADLTAALPCDLSDESSIYSLFQKQEDHFASLDLVVNNAGIALGHALSVPAEEWMNSFKRTVETNLFGPALVSKLALDRMAEIGEGVIVNVSSRGAYRGEPKMPGYGASKAGLNALTQSLAKAAGASNISVVAVAPGFVKTDMADQLLSQEEWEKVKSESPLNRIARPQEVAKLIAYLGEPHALHLSGSIVDINGASYFR